MPEITSWEKIETEKLSDKISRQMIFGEKAMLARIVLKRGAIVPRHSHVNEQITWIISGALKLIFDDGERVLRDGEMLLIPANVPHAPKRSKTPLMSTSSRRPAKIGSKKQTPTCAANLHFLRSL